MEVMPGYTQTEVGILPADWEVKPLGEFAQFRNGLNFIKSDKGDIVKVVGVADFQTNFSVIEDHLNSVQIAGSLGADDLLKGDDLLFVRSNGNKALIGRCVLIQGFQQPVSFSGFTIRGRVSSAIASPEYIGRYFQSNPARRQIKEAGEGSHISNLSQQVLASLKIPLPTLAEQEAIAGVLSDADALIASLEQLIAKKRQIKQGAMQELLTGKRRLPGFRTDWEFMRLGDLATLSKAGVNPATQPTTSFWHFSLPAFDDARSPVLEEGRFIGSNKFIVPTNGVLLSKLNPRIPRVWAPPEVPNNSVCSTEFLVLVPRPQVDRGFFAMLCRSPTVCYQMELHATGTTGSHQRISPTQALAIEVHVPLDADEQFAIAATLFDIEANISAMEAKLAKARLLKLGMMQELLTGRIRLI